MVNLRTLLLRARRRGVAGELDEIIARLGRARSAALAAPDHGSLLGVEGSASREYFRGFGMVLREPWSFHSRQRRPPPDPVNSLLSFGYSLLIQDVIAAVESSGLDPLVGTCTGLRWGGRRWRSTWWRSFARSSSMRSCCAC